MKTKLERLGWIPVLWYAIFLVGPLGLVFVTSLAARGTYGGIEWELSGGNFARAMDPLFSLVILRSFVLAAMTSGLCFAVGFPMALSMATASARTRNLYVLGLAIPFLTNLMIRICAIKSFVGYDGPLAWCLTALGVPFDRFALSQNLPLVLYGMVSTYLPFFVLPMFAALERFDFSLVEAAQDLGAHYGQVLARVLLPSLRHAIISSLLLVFIPSFGEFVIPDLLGGAKTMLIGNLISEQFLKARDWPFGSALSILLMIGLGLALFLMSAVDRRRRKEKEEVIA